MMTLLLCSRYDDNDAGTDPRSTNAVASSSLFRTPPQRMWTEEPDDTIQKQRSERNKRSRGEAGLPTRYYGDVESFDAQGSVKRKKKRSRLTIESTDLTYSLFDRSGSTNSNNHDRNDTSEDENIAPPISEELRNALGMSSQFQAPPFLPAMRRYGYPPGYVMIPGSSEAPSSADSNELSMLTYDAVGRSTIRQKALRFHDTWKELINEVNYYLGLMSNGWLGGCLLDAENSESSGRLSALQNQFEMIKNNEADTNAAAIASQLRDKVLFLCTPTREHFSENQLTDWLWVEEADDSSIRNLERTKKPNSAPAEIRGEYRPPVIEAEEKPMEPVSLEFFNEGASGESERSSESMSLGLSSDGEESDDLNATINSASPGTGVLVRCPKICNPEFALGGCDDYLGNPNMFLKLPLPICTCILPQKHSNTPNSYCLEGMLRNFPGLTCKPPVEAIIRTLREHENEPSPPGAESKLDEQVKLIKEELDCASGPSYRQSQQLAISQCIAAAPGSGQATGSSDVALFNVAFSSGKTSPWSDAIGMLLA